MNFKKLIIIIILIVAIVFFVRNREDVTETMIQNGVAASDVEIEDVTFSNITKWYEDGITNVEATMVNNTGKLKNFTVWIIFEDENGNEVQRLTQVVENLEPNRKKILSISVLGDYSKIENVEFEVGE